LIAPANGTSFAGWNAQVLLQWSPVGHLAANEYYVIRIPYDSAGGVAEFWRQDASFEVPANFSLAKVGFADRHYNWTVQVMHCTGNCDKIADDNAKKQGRAAGSISQEGLFYWHPDIGGGDKKETTSTSTWRPTPTPTPVS
jgi:hypothetical protein